MFRLYFSLMWQRWDGNETKHMDFHVFLFFKMKCEDERKVTVSEHTRLGYSTKPVLHWSQHLYRKCPEERTMYKNLIYPYSAFCSFILFVQTSTDGMMSVGCSPFVIHEYKLG